MIKTIIKKNSYLDSIFLMNASRELQQIQGVKQAILVMGSEMNKTVLEEIGQLTAEAEAAAPNDLIISLEMDVPGQVSQVLHRFKELILHQSETRRDGDFLYPTMEKALSQVTGANLAVISVPGEFAAREVRRVLERGLHAFIFSDNVPLSDEVELKKEAQGKGLLVMGPGCGAALINQVALGLMSAIKKGPIGIVGASGSGLQEIAVLIDHLGSGVSQAIGTGGRDLSAEVGGITMLQGFKYLEEDEHTRVIVLVSKQPSPETAKKIFAVCGECCKPVVINFLGGDREQIESSGALYASTLEEAAVKSVQLLSGGGLAVGNFVDKYRSQLSTLACEEKQKLGPGRKYLRGLFCGGTHSEEAILVLQDIVKPIYANLSLGGCRRLENLHNSTGHTIIDMGAEEFTRGKPHPVIDPSILNERLCQEGADPETAVLLFDLILGYGAHPDPVSAIAGTLSSLREKAGEEGNRPSMVASLCGSAGDPQGYFEQKRELEKLGVIVLPSNAQAATLAGLIIS